MINILLWKIVNTQSNIEINQIENDCDSSHKLITNEEQPNALSVNTLFTENTIDPNKKQNMYKNNLKKYYPDMNMCTIDAYVLVNENHININPEW